MRGRIGQRLERLEAAQGIDDGERDRQSSASYEAFMRGMDELAGRVRTNPIDPAELATASRRFSEMGLPDMLEYMRDEARLAHADRKSASAAGDSVIADDTPDAGFQRLVAALDFASDATTANRVAPKT